MSVYISRSFMVLDHERQRIADWVTNKLKICHVVGRLCWIIIDCIAGAIIRLVVSVCPSICLWALACLNRLTFNRDFWHEGWPWPWLAWNCMSRSLAKGQGQTAKIVYALPFEPVVQSRSILWLGLPSSASGNCEWPLPVHWNCLFASNQGRSTCRV